MVGSTRWGPHGIVSQASDQGKIEGFTTAVRTLPTTTTDWLKREES